MENTRLNRLLQECEQEMVQMNNQRLRELEVGKVDRNANAQFCAGHQTEAWYRDEGTGSGEGYTSGANRGHSPNQ